MSCRAALDRADGGHLPLRERAISVGETQRIRNDNVVVTVSSYNPDIA
ncbi:MAG TPA: hypothetical protein VKV04_06500 [Verrucomicrobiae bacterium]|nr:hypothetical protein [Verrucomicrobiae bacterium]